MKCRNAKVQFIKRFGLRAAAALVLLTRLLAADGRAEPLTLEPKDCVVILGNTFAERLHLFGYFETALHSRFPDHQLRVRNMGWSADEVDKQIRPLGFPKLLDELREHEADVILLCFGMNESFGGPEKVDHFQRELTQFVNELQQHHFNGTAAPRIVLVSPIAHERLGGDLPNPVEHNRNLRRYSEAMAETAAQQEARFVDLFQPTFKRRTDHAEQPLTFNGIHLTEFGDKVVGQMMAQSLGWTDEPTAPPAIGDESVGRLRRAIYEKNYEFFNWWHPPNASYIHGRRNDAQGAKHLAQERRQRQQLIAENDRRIWAMPKPGLTEIWRDAPIPGRPVWLPTPPDRRIPDTQDQPQWAVASDGEPATQMRSPQEQLKSFQLPDGYEVNLFASEVRFPIANPMAIQFDARGRLWVANTPTWPHALPGKQPQDSLIILEDLDRDGVADSHHVFLDKLNMIHGFSVHGDGAYVAQTPNLILARDTDGDDSADWFNVELHGFGAEDAEHAMNNFRWGPGGALYFAQGIFYHMARRNKSATNSIDIAK